MMIMIIIIINRRANFSRKNEYYVPVCYERTMNVSIQMALESVNNQESLPVER